jgi:hypothetical protein
VLDFVEFHVGTIVALCCICVFEAVPFRHCKLNWASLALERKEDNMNQQALEQEIARLKAENEALKANKSKPRTLSLKVAEKGGVSLYGMGRFPTTLYKEQWLKLAEFMPNVCEFITANDSVLKTKEESKAAKQTSAQV